MSHSTERLDQSIGEKISTQVFYGVPKLRDALRLTKLDQKKHSVSHMCADHSRELPRHRSTLDGPSTTWKVFKKQDIALNFARLRKNKLMTFVYQQTSGERIFIVAHPSIYWYYDVQREQINRCSFEIIPEHSVCKLYFDLEYDILFNSEKNGPEMTEVFINVVNCWLKHEFLIDVDRSRILDLDSTTTTKFSRHLIYQLPNAAFRDNYAVGNFVKMLCSHLRTYINKCICSSHMSKAQTDQPCEVDKYLKHICRSTLLELLVTDKKGNTKLFCDEAVYTKNRHFRLYCSTKRTKNAPLVLSPQNEYQYTSAHWSKEDIFLDSLITYFPLETCDLRLLEFEDDLSQSKTLADHKFQARPQDEHRPKPTNPHHLGLLSTSYTRSPHPEVDSFITSLVTPGRIWRWFYFSSSNFIVYDIIGYRYCSNIKRQHRSNGIKYIVNLSSCVYYQKCYDPDCMGYRSNEKQLPLEISFLYDDGGDLECIGKSPKDIIFEHTLDTFGMVDQEMVQVLDAMESSHLEKLSNEKVCKFTDTRGESPISFTQKQTMCLANTEASSCLGLLPKAEVGVQNSEEGIGGLHLKLSNDDIGYHTNFTDEELNQLMDVVEGVHDIF